MAAGFIDLDSEQIEAIIPIEARLEPDLSTHVRYSELFEIYKQTDRLLEPVASRLRKFERRDAAGTV